MERIQKNITEMTTLAEQYAEAHEPNIFQTRHENTQTRAKPSNTIDDQNRQKFGMSAIKEDTLPRTVRSDMIELPGST